MALNPPNSGLAAVANAQGRALDINPLTYLEKIQGFDGRKEDLSTFCMNVDDIIPTLASYNEQAQRMCINMVKGKLTGKARRAMEIHPHLNNWSDIKAMLETNFGGFQTTDQLYEDLRGVQYRGNTLEYYNYILHKLALLNQKCRQENRIEDVERNIQTALKIFTTRLPVYMRTVLCALKPTTMEEALHELSQSGFLNEERNKKHDNRSHKTHHQQTKYNNQQPQQSWRPKMYYPQNNQQFQPRNQQQQQFTPHRNNWQQNHQLRSEPMDIDASQQTRRQNHYQQGDQRKSQNPSKNKNTNTNLSYDYNINKGQNFRSMASPQTSGYPISYLETQPEI